MKKKIFSFDRRVSLTLANITTVREIVRVVGRGGQLQNHFGLFTKNLVENAQSNIPPLRKWHFDYYGTGVDFYPGNHWKVGKDENEYVCLSFACDDLLNPSLVGDPWIGLFVPEGWKHNASFHDMLNTERPEESDGLWEPSEDEWPRWNWLKIENYSNGKRFDVARFRADFVKETARLVDYYSTVDKILKRLKTK